MSVPTSLPDSPKHTSTSAGLLQGCHGHTTAGNGWAFRSGSGLCALASLDGAHLIEEISTRQRQPDLLAHLLAVFQEQPAQGLGLIFVANAQIHVMLIGDASLTVSTTRSFLKLEPQTAAPMIWPVPLPPANDRDRWELSLILDGQTIDPGPEIKLAFNSVTQAACLCLDLASDLSSTAAPPAPAPPATAPSPAPAPSPTPEAPAPEAPAPEAPAPAPSPVSQAPLTPAAGIPAARPPIKPAASGPRAAESIVFADDLAQAATSPGPTPPTITQSVINALPESPAQPPPSPTVRPAPVNVLGLACPTGHHNHPEAKTCSICKVSLQDQPIAAYIDGPRPDLGSILLDDGTSYTLDRTVLIGREVANEKDVRNGTVLGLHLEDSTLSTSRLHAKVTLEDWSVYIQDLNSSNGTWLQPKDSSDWLAVGQSPREIVHGDKVRIGSRTLNFVLRSAQNYFELS